MNTDNINKTLASLETNLRNLNSAREQVETVTDSADALTKSTSKLLMEIEQLSSRFDKDSASGLMQFSIIIEEFKEKQKEIIIQREKSILKDIKDFKQTTTELKGSLITSVSEISDANNHQLKTIENKLNSIITESKNDLDKNIEGFKSSTIELKSATKSEINEIKELSVSTIKQQTVEISNRLQEFKDISIKQGDTIQSFQKTINEKIEDQGKKHLIFSIMIMIIVVSGFIYLAFNK